MLAEGNPVARTARKEGTGSPCPMLPSRYHAIGWFVSTFLRGDDGTDLNGALKLQLCGSADPDFGRKLPDAHLKGVTSEKCKKKIPQTPLGASELKALNDHQENPWTRRGFGGRTITP